jgi:hypothetical protein
MKLGIIKQILPYGIVKRRPDPYFEWINGLEVAKPPHLYNEYGEEMKVFFLKDTGNPPYSLSLDRYPRYILWDRFNRALDTHFYVHEHVFADTYECKRKIAVLRESEEIMPQEYERALRRADIMREFSMILTHSERILDKYENARFAPANYTWYGSPRTGGVLSEKNFELKTKNISIIASDKGMCEIHKVRAAVAKHYVSNNRVDCFGRSVNNYIDKKADALENYRYSIVIENSETPFYFTEKILDCFAAMTVPIYYGATRIGDFFNTDGIIRLNRTDLDDFGAIDRIIASCSENDYENRLDAIMDNYRRVQDYLCYEDYLYRHFEELRDC